MIETMLDDLRKSFRETQRNGGFYGLSAQSERFRSKQIVRVYWRDYLTYQHCELAVIPEAEAVETLGQLYAELQALREETARPALALVA
jgi:hypothetical protein